MQVRKSRRPRRPCENLVQPTFALLVAFLTLVDKVITLVGNLHFHR
jgi:hypothetical protein